MSGRNILVLLGKGWGFPGIGTTTHFLTFMVRPWTVMAPVGMSFSLLMCYSEHIMKLKVLWKSIHLPSWTYLVVSLGYLILSKVSIPFSGWLSSKEFASEGNGNPLQYSCLGHPMDRGVWGATVHGGLKKSQAGLSDWTINTFLVPEGTERSLSPETRKSGCKACISKPC